MNWIKQNWVKIGLVLLILVVSVSIKGFTNTRPELALIGDATSQPSQTKIVDKECANAVSVQDQYLENEKLSEKFTFEEYKIGNIFTTTPADLDINSNLFAREFRTMLRRGLEEGVNFAGHYSIVSVGMTGWGDNYWIIDRSNGKAYTFPYIGYGLDFRKDSNLIILDSKSVITQAFEEIKPYGGVCYPHGIGAQGIMYTDLRPFYFLWDNNNLKLLGPTEIKPPINKFWVEYFRNTTEK